MTQAHITRIRRSELSREMKAVREMDDYCTLHPGSPAAVRRPHLSIHSGTWVALLGPSVEEGIAGFGSSVSAALKAFDLRYLKTLRPPDC